MSEFKNGFSIDQMVTNSKNNKTSASGVVGVLFCLVGLILFVGSIVCYFLSIGESSLLMSLLDKILFTPMQEYADELSHLNTMQQEPVKRSSKSVKKATPTAKKQSSKEKEVKTYTGKEPCTFKQFRACYYKQKEESKKPLTWQEFTDKYGDGKLTFEKASKMLSK